MSSKGPATILTKWLSGNQGWEKTHLYKSKKKKKNNNNHSHVLLKKHHNNETRASEEAHDNQRKKKKQRQHKTTLLNQTNLRGQRIDDQDLKAFGDEWYPRPPYI